MPALRATRPMASDSETKTITTSNTTTASTKNVRTKSQKRKRGKSNITIGDDKTMKPTQLPISSKKLKHDTSTSLPKVRAGRKRTAEDVLATADLSPEAQKRFQDNYTNSRLLSLPPEIRTRIWELVLGGKTVHVGNPNHADKRLSSKRKLYRVACKCESYDEEVADIIKTAYGDLKHERYHRRHERCQLPDNPKELVKQKSLVQDPMSLGLLTVCRQIHNESALIPFESNTFSFDWVLDMQAFARNLIPTQLSAVQHLVFLFHYFKTSDTFEEELQAAFQGLKTLTCFIEFHDSRAFRLKGPYGYREIRQFSGEDNQEFNGREKVRDEDAKCLLCFQRFPVTSAKVVAYNVVNGHWADQVPSALRQPWAKAIEDKLMADYSSS